MTTLDYSESEEFRTALRGFCADANATGDVSQIVTPVLHAVRERGDAAVLEYTEKFDGARLRPGDLRVRREELVEAKRALSAGDRKAIRASIAMVKDFHRQTLPKNWKAKNAHGATVGERFYPIRRVGLYIPGGNVPLVSTVVMTAVLAKLVKCPEIVVCTPPDSSGAIAPAMLAALDIIGVSEIYRVGGAQAVAAMAYGTKTIPAVDKIFGPGNAFVMEAKRQVLGTVGIDLLPGPSEIMVIADGGANPRHVAADLLAQAEHGSGKEILYLACTGKAILKKIAASIQDLLPGCDHESKCRKIIEERFVAVHCRSLAQAAAVADFIAPEHLELQVADKSLNFLTSNITTAGAILQGYLTPTAVGDFTAGPSHTLPTGRAGRFSSGLQAIDFMRRSSLLRYDRNSLRKAAPVVAAFANLERLDSHGRSVTLRV